MLIAFFSFQCRTLNYFVFVYIWCWLRLFSGRCLCVYSRIAKFNSLEKHYLRLKYKKKKLRFFFLFFCKLVKYMETVKHLNQSHPLDWKYYSRKTMAISSTRESFFQDLKNKSRFSQISIFPSNRTENISTQT